jgi:hypothetical protein
MPLPPYVFDTTLAIVPYHYILAFDSDSPSSILTNNTNITTTLAQARRQNLLTPQNDARLDLHLGSYLAQIHAIQNDFFGVPHIAPDAPCYSWQESFTPLLDALLHRAQHSPSPSLTHALPWTDVRRLLARAIACFLFDDVDVPALVCVTGSAEDVRVAIPSPTTSRVTIQKVSALESGAGEEAQIVSMWPVPGLAHALWGDPLLEAFFASPGPSKALREGYEEAGGGTLVVFPRQKTKRVWYDVFWALVVLVEGEGEGERREEALGMLNGCLDKLREAECY